MSEPLPPACHAQWLQHRQARAGCRRLVPTCWRRRICALSPCTFVLTGRLLCTRPAHQRPPLPPGARTARHTDYYLEVHAASLPTLRAWTAELPPDSPLTLEHGSLVSVWSVPNVPLNVMLPLRVRVCKYDDPLQGRYTRLMVVARRAGSMHH